MTPSLRSQKDDSVVSGARKDRVRIAVVGSGPFGALHAETLMRNSDVELVAIVNHDVLRARTLADKLGVKAAYESVEKLLDATNVDGITVATANAHHVAPSIAALQAGVSVLLEKPVAPTTAAAEQLLAAERASTGFVFPAHLLRFAAPYQELKHRIELGDIGTPRAFSFRRHRNVDHDTRFSDTHPVLMTMIHDIDLALWCDGAQPVNVTAREVRVAGRSQPTVVWAEVETSSGSLWSFQVSWSLGGAQDTTSLPDALEIVGEDGTLSLRLDPRVYAHSATSTTVDDVLTPSAAHGAMEQELREFADAVRHGRPPTAVTLEEAVAGLHLADRIIMAAAAGEATEAR
ncbi:Gfo/Idh/MocA family protein [Leucobacter aridicollis]|uniref:Gfo/Idh/MocA family protein n=1 Tax=Leucobacter aridicollis TaxID=283878 RepID=UPI00216A347D|nr:Gfo/Idh/MocA family oxidoreductase [Leucobacter aridicollis]